MRTNKKSNSMLMKRTTIRSRSSIIRIRQHNPKSRLQFSLTIYHQAECWTKTLQV